MSPLKHVASACAIAIAIGWSPVMGAADVEIHLHAGSERETAARDQLLRLLERVVGVALQSRDANAPTRR